MSAMLSSYKKPVSARLWPTALVGGVVQRVYGNSRVCQTTSTNDTTVLAPYDAPVDVVTAIAGTAASSRDGAAFPVNSAVTDTTTDLNEIVEPLFLQFDSLASAVNYLDRWSRRRKMKVGGKKRKLNGDVDESNSLTVTATSNGEARVIWLTNGNIKYRRVNADPTLNRDEWKSSANFVATAGQGGKSDLTSVNNGFNLVERSVTLNTDKKRKVSIPQNCAPILYEIAVANNPNSPFPRGKFIVFMGWIVIKASTDPRLTTPITGTAQATGANTTWYDNSGAVTWIPVFLYSIRLACKVTLDLLDLIDPVVTAASSGGDNFPYLPGTFGQTI